MSRFELTDHAVLRYRERHDPAASYEEGAEDLLALAELAAPLRSRSVNGDPLWLCPGWTPRRAKDAAPRAVLFVGRADQGKTVVVTVLPQSAYEGGHDRVEDEAEEMIAAYRRIEGLLAREAPPVSKADVQATRGELEELRVRAKAGHERQVQVLNRLAGLVAKVAAEGRKVPSHPPTLPAVKAEVVELRARVAGLEKRLERQTTHALRMDRERMQARKKLRELGWLGCTEGPSDGHPADCAGCGGSGYQQRGVVG